MASLINDPNGRKRIVFTDAGGERRTIRLGRCDKRTADTVRIRIEALLSARITGAALDRETALWLAGVGDELRDNLARAGLAEPAEAKATTRLGDFLDQVLTDLSATVGPSTMRVHRQAVRWLLAHFPADRRIDTFTPADADGYRTWLAKGGRRRATVAKWVRLAKQYFNVAVRNGAIAKNPFGHLSCPTHGEPHRRVFIPAADVLRVLDAIPSTTWKLLLAMARFQGIRVPSEAVGMTWADVDFERRRLVIRAPKTAHHDGRGIRVAPIFPEVEPLLRRAFDEAPEGATHVFAPILTDSAANLRTQLCRYITRAGLRPWPKPWQNLRVSRATELADHFPSHVCAAWLGHSEQIADAFYRQVTDDHFTRATTTRTADPRMGYPPAEKTDSGGVAPETDAARNAARPMLATSGILRKPPEPPIPQVSSLQLVALPGETIHTPKVGDDGLEPPPSTL